jgi:hypothetical protein
MRRRITAGVTAGVIAFALAVPSLGFAKNGGVPNSPKSCPTHVHSGKHKGLSKGKEKGSGRGKKCGGTGTK